VSDVNTTLNFSKLTAAGIILSGAWNINAAETTNTNSFQRPAWLTEASVGVKESYDNNVFLSGANVPNTVPAGFVAAVKDRSSWITTASPKVDVNFAPLLGDEKTLQVLSLAYAPDFVTFHDQDSESYNAQKFSTALKAGTDSVSVSADNNFTYVDGSDIAPVYPGGFLSAFSTVADRDRREQIQDKANFAAQFNLGNWFIRPTAALLYCDWMTEKLNPAPATTPTGYQNYADRYDVNGGADAGYKITSSLAVTLGYRCGHQEQEQFTFSPYSSPNDYQRVLLGLEGSPWKWLDVKIQGGPDFRNYEGDSATHTTPVNDLNPVKYYGEALLTAKFTSADSLTFKYKQWQWLSTLGKVPYFDSTYDLSYHRKLTSKLGVDLGARLLTWDFTSGNLSTCNRKDLQYTASAGLGYMINSHLSVNATYAFDWGRNGEDDIAEPENREFNHQLISLGAQCKF
jgi:hypothetical protein